jgi:hypothetical protein
MIFFEKTRFEEGQEVEVEVEEEEEEEEDGSVWGGEGGAAAIL